MAGTPSLEGFRRILRGQMPDLRRRFGVRSPGLFGSYVHDRQRPGSDLDVLVQFDDRPLTLIQFVQLENHLSDLLGFRVDLVERSALKPGIGRRVLEEVVPL